MICVWDARGGSSLSTMHDTMAFGVEVVYEAVHTADAFIEAKSQQLLRVTRDAPLVLVATDDMACREVGLRVPPPRVCAPLHVDESNTTAPHCL